MELIVTTEQNQLRDIDDPNRLLPLKVYIDVFCSCADLIEACAEYFEDDCLCPRCGNKLILLNEDDEFECEKCLSSFKGFKEVDLDIVVLGTEGIPESLSGFDFTKDTFWNLFGNQGLEHCGYSLEIIEAFNDIYPIKEVTFSECWFNVLQEAFLFVSDYDDEETLDYQTGEYFIEHNIDPYYQVPDEIYDFFDFREFGAYKRKSGEVEYSRNCVFLK